MRILINVNEQLSATMIENHFQAINIETEVTAASMDMMLEIQRACKIDLVALYAENIDNPALISFFNAIGKTCKILFVKKQDLGLVSVDLESILDECFTLPIDSNDLMIRLRRMLRAYDQKSIPSQSPQQQTQPIINEQPQVVQYVPPVQNIEPPTMPISPELPAQAQVNQRGQERLTQPINSAYTYTAESFRHEVHEQQTAPQQPPAAPYSQDPADQAATFYNLTPGSNTGNVSAGQQADLKKSIPQGKGFFMKTLSVISRVLFTLLIIVIAVLAIFMVKSKVSGGTPSVAGYQLYGVISGSMNGDKPDSFDTGSLVFVKYKDVNNIVVGDIITFRGAGANSPLTTHRVVKVNKGPTLTFTTRGDANNVDDPNPILAEKVVGTVRGHVPLFGYLTGFAQTRTGLIFLIFIPGAIVIAYETYNIFRVLKQEKKKKKT